jgi:glycosyltransferase involved in cell wall biosynthesis
LRVAVYTDADGIGGAEISLGHLVAAIPAEDDVTLLGCTPAVVDHLAARRSRTAAMVLPAPHGTPDLRVATAHLAAVWRLRPDVLHVNLPVPWAGSYALLAGVLSPGTAVVAVEQLPIKTTSATARWWKRVLSARLAAHVAVGDASARETEVYAGLPAGSVRVIRNGVIDPGVLQAAPHDGTVLVAVGRLTPQKAFDVLLDALAELPAEVRLVLVGDGEEHAALRAQATTLRVSERVTITGWTDRVSGYLAQADIFVLPSRSEGFPLAIAEAMLAGLPVVATAVGSVPEAVVDGETGLLVGKDDRAALAAALRKLVDDAALRRRMGQRGRVVAAPFTAQRMAAAYLALWREVAPRA